MKFIKTGSVMLGLAFLTSCSSLDKLDQRDFDTILQDLDYDQENETSVVTNDLTLRKAKLFALENSPDIKAAMHRVEQANAILKQSQSSYYPTIGVTTGFNHIDWNQTTGENQKYFSTIGASWLLFDGLNREFSEIAAIYKAEASEAAIQESKRLLCKGVSQAYLSVILQQKLLKISEADRDFNKKLLRDTEVKENNQFASKADVLNFQVRYNNSLISVITVERNICIAKVALAELIGIENSKIPNEVILTLPNEVDISLSFSAETEIQKALLRPDMQIMARHIAAAEANINAAQGALYPTLSANSEYGYSRDNNMHYSSDDKGGTIGVALSLDFDLGGEKRATLAKAEAVHQELTQILQGHYNAICSEVRQEVKRLSTAQSEFKIAQKTIALSTDLREMEKLRWIEGEVSITRLNEVQTELIRSEARAAVSMTQLLISMENLAAITNSNVPNKGRIK